MKKAVKKPSTKLIVDQFDKYYRKDDEFKLKKAVQNKKISNYHRFIQHQLPQKQAEFQQNYQFHPYKKEELRESLYKKKNKEVNQMIHEKICQRMSDDEEEKYDLNSQSKRQNYQKGKKQPVKERQAMKKAEPFYFNESRRDYDYYPENFQKKEKKDNEKLQKEKRPLSAMNKKYQVQQKPQKPNKKEGESIMKKTLSTSKFKQQHKNLHSSLHKQKAEVGSQHKKHTEYLKNNSIPHKQLNNHYKQMPLNNLKKKTVITKPLKIEELHKVYSNHDSSKKLNSSQLMSKIRYPKEEQRIEIRPKKQMKREEEQKKEEMNFGGKTTFFSKRQNLQRQHSQKSEFPEEIKRKQNNFQQQKRQKASEEQRERVLSRRRRAPMTQNDEILREEPVSQARHVRQQRREREQPTPQPASRNQNQRRQNQPRQQRRQGQPPRRPNPNRNNRNPRYQSSTSRRQENPNNIFRLVSQTINGQLQFINNQFNMMSNIFENISNFVNINIDTNPNYYFGAYGQYSHSNDSSSDGFNSDSSESYSSQYDYYEEEEPQGLDEEELEMIGKIKYKVAQHGSHQCTICLIQLKNGDEAKKLFCDHLFHSDCIDEWLRRKSDCPVCRDKQGLQ